MKHFEEQFETTQTYTDYPFVGKKYIKYLHDISMIAPSKFYISEVRTGNRGSKIYFNYLNGDPLGESEYFSSDGIFTISPELGYFEVVGYYPMNQIYTSDHELLYGVNYISLEVFDSEIKGFVDGYNNGYSIEDSELSVDSNSRAGIGEYCGNYNDYDAVYEINGQAGPNLEWTEEGFFRITPDEENHKLSFSLSIPNDLCERDGYKGPKGDTGPAGRDGQDGVDVVTTIIIFDPTCSNPT